LSHSYEVDIHQGFSYDDFLERKAGYFSMLLLRCNTQWGLDYVDKYKGHSFLDRIYNKPRDRGTRQLYLFTVYGRSKLKTNLVVSPSARTKIMTMSKPCSQYVTFNYHNRLQFLSVRVLSSVNCFRNYQLL
jgi:hypothetical protein